MSVALQEALRARGFDPGPLDGKVGPRTKRATKDFQRANRLLVDGIAGPRTLAALGLTGAARLDRAAFAKFAPDALPNTYEALAAAIKKYPALGEAVVLDDFLGQCWVESLGFSRLAENLNYSAEALKKNFGRHRISLAEADRYGRTATQKADQRAIANTIYGGEWGKVNLGNIHPTDGWDNRGSGFIQNTGRRNITATGFTAEQLRTDVFAAADAAAQFFISHGCVLPARNGAISQVTKRINGGNSHLVERSQKTAEARAVIR